MEALLAEAPRATDVARAIASQLSVIGPIEDVATQLQDASQAVFAGYHPRAPLGYADLVILKAELPPIKGLQDLRFDAPEAWLGFRYVVEGSSLGGALILRRLAAAGLAIDGLCFFDVHGANRGAEWQKFCAMLDAALNDERSRTIAAQAAGEIFDAIRRAMEEIA